MILDSNGNKFQREVLAEPQTSRLQMLYRSMAGHPARGLTPARLNTILEEAESGNLIAQHELFRDMEERDGHLFAELSKRKRAVIKLDWDIVPPRNASKADEDLAAYAKELVSDLPDFEDMLFDALDGIGHGFSALELEWVRLGSDWTINKFHHRPQAWFQTDWETHSKLLLRDSAVNGLPLQPFGWILHIHKAMSGYTVRSGLSRVLVWPYLFKHFAVGDLAEFLDIYGLPLRVGKFPSNATPEEKSTLWQAVAGIGHNAAGIIPQSMAIEFEEAAKGTEKPFEAMISWCERTQSKAILGSTLTSEAGSTGLGSGMAEIHNEVRIDIRDSDCKQLAGTITRDLIYPLLALNKGVADIRRCPRFVLDVSEPEDLTAYADALPKLVSLGMKIPSHWAHDRLQIPLAQEGDDVLSIAPVVAAAAPTVPLDAPAKKPAKGAAAASTAMAALSAATDAHDIAFADQDAVDGALSDLEPGLQAQVEAWLEPALAALRQEPSADAALALLAQDNPLVADNVLIEAIARAMFICELVGADAVSGELAQ